MNFGLHNIPVVFLKYFLYQLASILLYLFIKQQQFTTQNDHNIASCAHAVYHVRYFNFNQKKFFMLLMIGIVRLSVSNMIVLG